MKKYIIAIFITLVWAGTASAVTLINQDSRSYDIVINGSGTVRTTINGNTTKGVCSSCTIEVKGVGSIEASGSDKVIIKDGSLKKN